MLDLNALNPTGRILYAQSLAGALSAGVSPIQAEAIAAGALQKAGLLRVAKSAEPVRIAKRLEVVKAKPKPELEDEIGRVDDDVDVRHLLEVTQLAQFQLGERGLQRAAPADHQHLLDTLAVQRIERVVGNVGLAQQLRI
mgnify:CR=1 FL=1